MPLSFKFGFYIGGQGIGGSGGGSAGVPGAYVLSAGTGSFLLSGVVYEASAIVGTCINCVAPGSLSATLALVVIGAGIALQERRKLARVRGNK